MSTSNFVNRRSLGLLASVTAFVATSGIATAAFFPSPVTPPTTGGSTADSFAVSASVVSSCTVSSTNVTFSSYDPTSTSDTLGSGTVTVLCTPGAGIAVGMGPGKNSVGTQRTLNDGKSGDAALNYNILQPSSSVVGAACVYGGTPVAWGDGTSATTGTMLPIGPAPSVLPRTYNVCGVIPHGQSVSPGSYADSTVAATITF